MLLNNGIFTDPNSTIISHNNPALTQGHSVLEKIRVQAARILFWESHYLKIMSSMRMLRIAIPNEFTPDFLAEKILSTLAATTNLNQNALVYFQVYPSVLERFSTQYHLWLAPLKNTNLAVPLDQYVEMGLYKDYYVANTGLSSIPTNNKLVQALAATFSLENNFEGCFLLNTEKEVIETNIGNLYMLLDNEIHTPPLSSGTTNNVYRTQLNEQVINDSELTLIEAPISPFSLQKATALFIVDVNIGVLPISKYRKKTFEPTELSLKFASLLNLAASKD